MPIFIEAKFTASNYMTVDKESKLPKYENGTDRWYGQAFGEPALHIAREMKLYELMRFWLLGSWLADKMNKSFVLLSLTRELMDPDLANRVTPLLRQNDSRRFQQLSWEQVHDFIRDGIPDSAGRGQLLTYMRHKTAGYSGGRLQRAFQLEETDPSCRR